MQQKCRVCKSEDITFLLTSENIHGKRVIDETDKFNVYRCNGCKSLLLGDIEIDVNYYKKYYQDDYYNFSSSTADGIRNLILKTLERFCLARRMNFIPTSLKKVVNGKLNLLDVGCGDGGFLKLMPESLFNKFGLEINTEACTICKEKGFKVFNSSIEDLDPKDLKFDVITMWHVLEHVSDPEVVLTKVNSLLSQDGVLVFSVPDAGSMGFKLGKKLWFHLDSPRHLFIPSDKGVEDLLAFCRFKVTKKKNAFYEFPLDIFWSVRKSPYGFFVYLLYPFIKILSRETTMYCCQKEVKK